MYGGVPSHTQSHLGGPSLVLLVRDAVVLIAVEDEDADGAMTTGLGNLQSVGMGMSGPVSTAKGGWW